MVKNLPTMQETWFPSLGQGRSPGGGKVHPLQYSCLERGPYLATVQGSQTAGHNRAINTYMLTLI